MPKLQENTQEEIASHADYAAMAFKADYTEEEANRISGEILSGGCVLIRAAAIILSMSKEELLNSIGQDKETLMETIEQLQSQEQFLDELKRINERAVVRLLSVAASVIPEDGE